jgi:hypothetical protein
LRYWRVFAAYRAYISANLGWRKALMGTLVWLAGMFAPLWAKALVQLPTWVAMRWMICWALLGLYFCALRIAETPPHSDSKFTSARR